jgi:hypothetical protein
MVRVRGRLRVKVRLRVRLKRRLRLRLTAAVSLMERLAHLWRRARKLAPVVEAHDASE